MPKLSQSRKIFELSLLILAAGTIFPLVYLRQNFETAILTLFHMDQAELAGLYTMLGWMFVIGYIPSGWLADRLSVKLLLIFSLLLTASTGLVFAQIPDKSTLIVFFLLWGFATVFTFWSSLLKTVNLLAGPNEEGRFFGALDGGRGLVEAILASTALAIFAAVAGGADPSFAQTKAGFQAVIYMYCGAIFLIAAALFFLMPSRKEEQKKQQVALQQSRTKDESTFASVKRLVKIREVWLMIFIIFCGYTLFWTHYYFSGFLNENRGATQVAAGVVTVFVLWMRPIGGFGGGYLADKLGRSRVLSVSMFLTAAILIAVALLPVGVPNGVVYVMLVVAGLLMYVIRGVYWSLLDECRVPVLVVGLAIGFVSFFGYLPDVVIPFVSGIIYTSFGEDVATANNVFFLVSAAIGLLGAGAAFYFHTLMKKRTAVEAAQEKVEAVASA